MKGLKGSNESCKIMTFTFTDFVPLSGAGTRVEPTGLVKWRVFIPNCKPTPLVAGHDSWLKCLLLKFKLPITILDLLEVP